MMRTKKNVNEVLLDPVPNSPNWHNKNCITDSKENY